MAKLDFKSVVIIQDDHVSRLNAAVGFIWSFQISQRTVNSFTCGVARWIGLYKLSRFTKISWDNFEIFGFVTQRPWFIFTFWSLTDKQEFSEIWRRMLGLVFFVYGYIGKLVSFYALYQIIKDSFILWFKYSISFSEREF